MTTEKAVSVLRRFQRFNRWKEDQLPDPSEVDAALTVVLDAVPALTCSLQSVRRQLTRCQVQRERFHSQLRRKVAGVSTQPPEHA